MNKAQEKKVAEVARNIEAILGSVQLLLNDGDNALTEIRDALEEAYADMSEKAQETERGQKNESDRSELEEAIVKLEEAQTMLEEAADTLKTLIGGE